MHPRNLPLGGEASHRKEKTHEINKGMTPLFGEMKEERVSLLLFQAMKNVKEDLKEMKGEKCRKFLRGFEREASPSYSHYGCEHSVTHVDPQHILFPTFTARRMEEGDAPREETLSVYLQEYESQSLRFKEHLDFQGFFQLKEDRRSNNRSKGGIIFLPNFDGLEKYTAKAWEEELDSYFQIHQVS